MASHHDPAEATVPAADLDDGAAIVRSRQDPEAFAVIFDRHAPRIFRYLTRRLGADAASDVLEETFLAAFRKRGGYDSSRADAAPWLYGIATKLVSQHRRNEVRYYRLLLAMQQNAFGGVPDSGHADQVAMNVTAQAARGLLAEALATLNPRDRDVVLLIAREELSYEETAQALGVPVGTIRSRLNRARKHLRAALGDENPVTTDREV